MAELPKSNSGNSMPRRILIKLASLVGSSIPAERLLDHFSSFAYAAEGVAATGDEAGPVPKANDLYVATNGDDNAAGTQAAPFQMLNNAQSTLRTMRPIDKPMTVWVSGGTHYLIAPLIFTPDDGGSAHAPITYAAYPNETVILSGNDGSPDPNQHSLT